MGNATILATGGAGFIGSNFIRHALAGHPKIKIVCVDALTYAGSRENLKGLDADRFVFVKGDITDSAHMARVFRKHEPQYIINFAAESHVDRSIHLGAHTFMHTNVLGTTILLDTVRKAGYPIKKFLQVSTDEVYGSLDLKSKKKFTETSPLAPNSPYAASKAAADLAVRSFYVTHRLPLVITRCSNNYGPYQYPEKLIPYSTMLLSEGKPMKIYGDGLYVRDWIHVEDHCRGLVAALESGRSGQVYNFGAASERCNIDIVKSVLKLLGKSESLIQYVRDRPGHDRRYAIDAMKARRELGWEPRHRFDEALGVTVQWYREHRGWWERIRTGEYLHYYEKQYGGRT